jgi:predicted transcriptional regulator of viral defense system
MYVTNLTQNIRKGITEKETQLLCTLAKEGKSIIDLKDISRITGESYGYVKVIANRLCKKKWLITITKGRYLISPLSAGDESEYTEHEFVIASHLAKKGSYYISYWNALNYYGYTEQTPLTVFVATTHRLANIKIHGVRYKFVTIKKTKNFGTKNQMIVKNKIIISDREKTITDALDHPEYCGGIVEVAKCLWNASKDSNVSFDKIIKYAKRMENRTIIKRLGYLIDVLEIKIQPNLYKQMPRLISSGYSWFDTHSTITTKIKSNSKWKLFINIDTESILNVKNQ